MLYVLTQIPCHCPHLTAPPLLGTRANRPVMVARRQFVDALDQGISLVPFGKCSVKYTSLYHELINSDSNNNFNDDDDDDGDDYDYDDEDDDDDDNDEGDDDDYDGYDDDDDDDDDDAF